MKLYKLTDEQDQTKNATQWGEGVMHIANGEGDLCGPGWLHAYEDPLLAVLHNPIYGNFKAPHLWEAEGAGEVLRDGQMKIGVTRLTTVRRIDLPEVTRVQRTAYGILCAKSVYSDVKWNQWADKWLSGEDRSEASARYAARYAAWAAAYAADAAVYAVYAVYAAEAASTGKPLDLIRIAKKAMTYK